MLINIIINEDCPNICSLWMGNFLLSLALVKENLTAVRRSFHIYWTAFSRALLWDVEAHNGLEISKLVFKISAKACTSHLQSWKKVETLFLPPFLKQIFKFSRAILYDADANRLEISHFFSTCTFIFPYWCHDVVTFNKTLQFGWHF